MRFRIEIYHRAGSSPAPAIQTLWRGGEIGRRTGQKSGDGNQFEAIALSLNPRTVDRSNVILFSSGFGSSPNPAFLPLWRGSSMVEQAILDSRMTQSNSTVSTTF